MNDFLRQVAIVLGSNAHWVALAILLLWLMYLRPWRWRFSFDAIPSKWAGLEVKTTRRRLRISGALGAQRLNARRVSIIRNMAGVKGHSKIEICGDDAMLIISVAPVKAVRNG